MKNFEELTIEELNKIIEEQDKLLRLILTF